MSTAEAPAEKRLSARSAGLSMTPAEFDAAIAYDDSVNYELINGVLVVSPVAPSSERSPNELLGNWLFEYEKNHPAGKCLVKTSFEEHLRTRSNRRRAGRVIWVEHGDKRPNPKTDTPTIVVEFVSAGKAAWHRDNVEKRDEYLDAGVAEYWVIDRFRRILTVYSQQADQPVEQIVPEISVYRSPLLPGFELRLAELLAAADWWSETDEPGEE
jgi:Uma2 family endonuclease